MTRQHILNIPYWIKPECDTCPHLEKIMGPHIKVIYCSTINNNLICPYNKKENNTMKK
ncbi:MAG: hypothetical protein GTO54_09175 [Nitrososphaeria archaeon]|nr:hypothetical protein [Nitrososphaeria archaeon]